jgi:hypothetical protein
MNELPGQRITDVGTTPRQFLLTTHDAVELPGPIVLDHVNGYDGANTGREDELRAGQLMAKVTATGLWVPVKRTQVNGTSGANTEIILDDASAFQVGDVVTIGADTAITITAINYTTNTITITSTTVADNDPVFATAFANVVDAAGCAIARGILSQSVRLRSGIPYEDDTVAKSGVIVAKAFVNTDMILGDYEACLASGVTNYLNGILWSDRQGAT